MKLGEIFRDGVIFQKGKPIRVFGESEGEASITFAGNERKVPGGKFVAEFPEMDYGGPYELVARDEKETVKVSDIYIGEILLCSGQSNMQFRMGEGAVEVEPREADDMLRIFVSDRIEKAEPLTPADGWTKARPENIDKWSAIGYQAGRELRKKGVPAVGIVACSQGASVIQSWIDEKVFVGSEVDIHAEEFNFDFRHPLYSAWNANGRLYHYMFERLVPFSFGGVVWYQGESNASVPEGKIYDGMLDMMIRNWRGALRDEKLFFIVIQIADNIHEGEGWKEIQEAELRVEKLTPYVKTVISADVCENDMIHPVTKWKLAKRVADCYFTEVVK